MICLNVLFEFCASHRLYRPDLSDDENRALFGKCSNPAGHGHNYTLEVSIKGEPQARDGMIIDAAVVKEIVNRVVIEDLDHKSLNTDVPWLEGMIPSTENTAQAIFNRLAPEVARVAPHVALYSVRLNETRRIGAIVYGDMK